MKIKRCTDVDGSIIQQHLFVFVDLFSLSENVTETGRNDGAARRRPPPPLQSPSPAAAPSLFIYADVLGETSGVI